MKAAPPARHTSRSTLTETLGQLYDLISAIDRRLPQVQRVGESSIANAAVRLRIEAFKRIVEIEALLAGRPSDDARPAD